MNKKAIILSILFLLTGILSRTVFHIGENIELITSIGLTAGILLSRELSHATVFFILMTTDFIIGNSSIMFFTWSAFLCTPLLGIITKKFLSDKQWSTKLLAIQAEGALFTLFFYLWTNLGVVLTTSMYTKNLAGLVESYAKALPFLRNQIGGNLIFVPLIFTLSYILLNTNFLTAIVEHRRIRLNKNYGRN